MFSNIRTHYRQIKGIAIGNKCGPSIANIFVFIKNNNFKHYCLFQQIKKLKNNIKIFFYFYFKQKSLLTILLLHTQYLNYFTKFLFVHFMRNMHRMHI
jgi:hypothetical protein